MAEVRTIDSDQKTETKIIDGELELEDETKIYEISFHIVPSISPEDLVSEFEKIKKIVSDKEEREIIAESFPSLRNLAYKLSKTVKTVKSIYTQANFGWIKFVAHPHNIDPIKNELDKQDQIIRYLIISTVRENTLHTNLVEKDEDGKAEDDQIESREEVDEEELDKTIDEMVAE